MPIPDRTHPRGEARAIPRERIRRALRRLRLDAYDDTQFFVECDEDGNVVDSNNVIGVSLRRIKDVELLAAVFDKQNENENVDDAEGDGD